MRTNLPCLPLIEERFWNAIKDDLSEEEKKYKPEFTMDMFEQTWGSTALGFGGIGGQAMTSAYTTVIQDVYSGWYGVFFGERLAYKIKKPNQKFNEDVLHRNMKPAYQCGVYKNENK